MSDGSEFQVCGAATENARRASSVRVLAAESSWASEDRRGRTGTAGRIRSSKYVGVDDESTLNVNVNSEVVVRKRGAADDQCLHSSCG